MDLFLVRHGKAEHRSDMDEARTLVGEGKKRTHKVAQMLKELEFTIPQIIAVSPLVRAKETADIIQEVFAPDAERVVSDALRSESSITVTMAYLSRLAEKHKSIMVVGHEPHLSTFASALICGGNRPNLEMKTSSVAVIELTSADPVRMHGYLKALLPSPDIKE